jgi:hypothetical protein
MTDTEPDTPEAEDDKPVAEHAGVWLRRAPTGAPHRCAPPEKKPARGSDLWRPLPALANAGDVWRCGCGRLWVCYIRVPNAHYSGRGMAEAGGTRTPTWRRAGLWLRVRYAEIWHRFAPETWAGLIAGMAVAATIAILALAGITPPP